MVTDAELQRALAEAIRKRPELLFKAAEHAYGRPRQSLDVNPQEMRMFIWPDDSDVD